MNDLTDLISARSNELFYYSPYNFIHDFSKEIQFKNCVENVIINFENENNNNVYKITCDGQLHQFYVTKLSWDTQYFGINTIKLKYVLYAHQNFGMLQNAVREFLNIISSEKKYCFIEIPSEDILLLKAITSNSFNLIETRLTYFRRNLSAFNNERYAVRKANLSDTENLKRVARVMRNDFDRFHADPVFSKEIADEFLATYIEQSIKGFADVVLVPDETGIPADSFLTANYLKDDWTKNKINISKMVLSAVSAQTNKGWYKKLVSEMTYQLYNEGAEYIYMNTQSTNRAVIYTWEKLGYKLGCTTHILSYNNL